MSFLSNDMPLVEDTPLVEVMIWIRFAIIFWIRFQPPEQNSEAVADGALKNFENFTWKQLWLSLFFTKLQAFMPAMLLKRDF